jgi:hypothetical protein
MNERELLADCLRRLNRTGITLRHWARELQLAGALDRLLSGEIKPKQT